MVTKWQHLLYNLALLHGQDRIPLKVKNDSISCTLGHICMVRFRLW